MPLFLLQVGVLLCLAHVLGRLAGRLGWPALVGELLAGVILGPTVLGHAAPQLAARLFPPGQSPLLDAVSQFGVLLVVAVTGAHTDPGLLRGRGMAALRISLAGLLVPLALGVAAGYLLPRHVLAPGASRDVFAAFLGVAMCVTALPVISKILADLNLLHRRVGQFIVVAALFDDAAGWLLLSVVSAMAAGRDGTAGVLTAVAAMVVFLAIALLSRRLARRALPAISRDPGSATAVAVALVLLGGAATASAGLEAMFGAFVVGASLLTLMDPVRLAPLRTIVMSVLAPIFLAGIGLRLDLTALARPQILVVGAVLLLIATVGKFAGAYLGARSGRLGHREALALGAGMNARGMVEVVIATAGLNLGVLTPAMFTVIVFIAIVTSLAAPPLMRMAMRRVRPDADERARETRQAAWRAGVA